ncbi:polysaccharide deacetylase family protein [Marinobacter sp. M216]|uniref:Polysaccharide deacetylase family protein n=1 Tax=Marinobacter albus TaxID=3030833 RepID=A0ABT7HAY6_9GAMM|nr:MULTISPECIES: polysaccharide deacetylase family protein [unclassified Marinobacter]MBW7470199.1 polysaccharide deacetylase family protein [Marinobacter sp. F4218]MDK9557537.1 polysaccharide deacetylase family protein [Marinobacter sp. M216]
MAQRTRMKPLLLLALFTLSLQVRADLVVLQYHHVSDSTPPSTSTSVSLFEAQMDLISDLKLPVVPLKSGTEEALASEPGTENRLAITFDDAYDSVYSTAAPILSAKNFPYTIFVNTEAVGREGYMTWEQLRELAQRGDVTLANHSADHKHLVRKPGESETQWARRVEYSLDSAQTTLREKLGSLSPLFAYPYGEFDSAVEAKLAERGWYGYGQHSGAIAQTSGETRLPRFPMANAYGQINGLENKLRSKTFPIDAASLPDGVISTNPPRLTFRLPASMDASGLTCFASGMGRIDFDLDGRDVTVQAPGAFDSRRFRYNCTYPAGDGSYFWLSKQWLDLTQPED